MPGAQRVIEYHVIARGACWGHAVGQEPIRLREGDLFVLPQGDAPVPRDAPARPDGLARGIARSRRRTGAGRAAWRGERAVDRRTAGAARRRLAFGPRGAIHGIGRPAPDAVPRVVAHATRLPP